MRSDEAVVGKRVRVRPGYQRQRFRGASGTIRERYGDPEYVALDVEFEDGGCELFWHHELEEAGATRSLRVIEDVGRRTGTVFVSPIPGEAAKMYWLIVERGSFRISVYALPDQESLPVFSHERGAAAFLRAGGLEGGWRSRETSVGELASLLLGPYAHVSNVTLDPLAENESGPPADLAGVDRKDFVDSLMRDFPADPARIGVGR